MKMRDVDRHLSLTVRGRLVMLAWLALPALVSAQTAAVQSAPIEPAAPQEAAALSIPLVAGPPKLADVWEGKTIDAVMVANFWQREPGDGVPSSSPTFAYVSHDAKNLYVIFDCRDETGEIRASLANREAIGDDDRVFVFLDTFRDRRRAYMFAVNPLAIQQDGILTEGQDTDLTYDTVWHSEAKLDVDRFVVMIAIPFSSLRFSAADTQTWGIALGRYIRHNSEYSYWPYITNRIDGFVNQMGELRNITHRPAGRNVQLIPYGALTGSRFLDTKARAFTRSDEGRGGVDSKVIVRDALTLDVTLNPDFSQVESDEPQVTVNKRFEVFFPEKRPFFIENAGIFQTPENLFFSRRIVDPEFGARLTGKIGGWTVGTLIADDRSEGREYPTDSAFFQRRAIATVARAQREVGQESFIGVLATNRTFSSATDWVISADTRLKLTPNWIFSGQIIRNDTRQLDGGRLKGAAYNAAISRTGRHFSYSGSYTDLSPDFETPLGFIKRSDIRQTSQYVGYFWRPKKGAISTFGPSLPVSVDWNYKGLLQDWYVQPEIDFYFKRPFQIKLSRSESYEAFGGLAFREHTNRVSVYSARATQLSVYGSVSYGTTPNYSPPSGMAPFLGDTVSASLGITFRPSKRLRLDQTYYFNQLQAPSDWSPTNLSQNVFTNQIVRTKLGFQFTRNASVRAIVDYNTLVPNSSLISYTLSKHVTGDVLFTYLPNPFTFLYVGYVERYQNLDLDPANPSRLRILDSPSILGSRQLFVKLSYLFRL